MKTETPNETRYTHDFPSHYRKVITELERENTAMSSMLTLNSRELDQLRRKNAALREDKERLDWLEVQGEPVTYEDEPHELVWSVFGKRGQRNLRDAIDAARKEAQP